MVGRRCPYFALARVCGPRLVTVNGYLVQVCSFHTGTLRPGELYQAEALFRQERYHSKLSSHAVMTSLTLSLWILASHVLAMYARILFPYNMKGMRASWLARSTPQNTPEIITA